jgi:hypothetical protein
MPQDRRARKHAPSALRPACERLEGRALLSGARARAFTAPVQTVQVGMSAPSTFFLQQSGSAQITLTRAPFSAQGTLSVEFSTDRAASPESAPAKAIAAATPCQQYRPVDDTVTFQPGRTALTVSVPIVLNAANPGIVLVEMTTL